MQAALTSPRSFARHPGVLVAECVPNTPAWRAGIRAGDRILTIDELPTRDSIDLHFHAAEESFDVLVRRDGQLREFTVERPHGELLGLIASDPPIRECANLCPFCFVDQAPKNRALRPELEIRDDDYRYSFLYGHYVTLTNLTRLDKERIKEMRLSPLYLSVHATEPELRAKLLGRPRVPVLPLIEELVASGIELHAQIVLCKGVNDGAHLERTVADLFAFQPGVASVAVVPVGLTDHHDQGVEPWDRHAAGRAIDHIVALGRKYPAGFVQAADEWFAMLKLQPPPFDYYGGMQVEANGVGMVRRLLDDWARVRLPKKVSPRSLAVFTGISPRYYIQKIVDDLAGVSGMEIEMRAVKNETFGHQTTVTGLLCWSDLRREILKSKKSVAIIPEILLDGYGRFLDNVTLDEAQNEAGRRIIPVDATAAGFRCLAGALKILEGK